MKVISLFSSLPSYSETFITNELLYLHKKGIKVDLWYFDENESNKPFHDNEKKLYENSLINKVHGNILKRKFFSCLAIFCTFIIKNPFGLINAIFTLLKYFSAENLRFFLQTLLIANAYKSNKKLIIYIHDNDHVTFASIFLKQLLNIPCNVIFHTRYLFQERSYLNIKSKYFDKLIFQSKYSAVKFLLSSKNQYREKIKIIYSPGIDTKKFSYRKRNFNQNKLKILVISRLEEMKGIDLLIKSIKTIHSFDISLTIIGSGSDENMLRKISKGTNVKFLGPLKQNRKFLNEIYAANLFVLPSRVDQKGDRDMQPNAIKEAMSTGLPVITSKLGGITEVIKHGYDGILIDPNDQKQLTTAIVYYYKLTPDEKSNIGFNASEKILKKFNEEKTLNKLISLLESQVNNQ